MQIAAATTIDTPPLPHEFLSAREMSVFVALGSGLRVWQIAELLKLSIKTVSTYHVRAKKKLGIKSQYELIRYCVQHRLVEDAPEGALVAR